MRKRLDVPTKRASIIYPLAPSFKIIKRRQGVNPSIDGKLKNSLWDIPQVTFPSDTTIPSINNAR